MRLKIKKSVVKKLNMAAFPSEATKHVNGGALAVLWSEGPTCGVICVPEDKFAPTCGIGCQASDKR